MSQKHVETSKHWIEQIVERISRELNEEVVITHWDFHGRDAEYRLYVQIAGQNEEPLAFTRCTLETCGKHHPSYEAVRRRVEAIIRNRLLLLTKH
jgi:hypothetical protein